MASEMDNRACAPCEQWVYKEDEVGEKGVNGGGANEKRL